MVKKQGECSAESSFGTSQFGSSSSSVLTSDFGKGLDGRFNGGATGLPSCCLNTIMLSVNVVEPESGGGPSPLVKADIASGKYFMAKGGVMMCNVSVPVCESMQEQLRSVIATNTASYINKSDVWLECKNGDFQQSNASSGDVVSTCSDTSFVDYEVYMSSAYFNGAFFPGSSDIPLLQTLIERNDGSENTTGVINGSQPYNYVFVEALKDQIETDGLSGSISIGLAKASLTDFQAYKDVYGTRIFQPRDPATWGVGMTSLKSFDSLNGRITALSADSQMSNCSSSSNPYCVGLVRHNE
jgi:hypothetical protein